MQTWLMNDGLPELQTVEAGWTVDGQLNGDTVAHIFTYFTTNGYYQDGNNLGGYNAVKGGVKIDHSGGEKVDHSIGS